MDWEALRAFLLVDEAKAPPTVDYMIRRLQHAERHGMHLGLFETGPEPARTEGRRYLLRVRTTRPLHAYNNTAKSLNALARFLRFDGLRFKMLREPPQEPRRYMPDELQRLLAWSHRRREVNLRGRALLRWLLVSAMRRSEVARLNQDDLNPSTSMFRVATPAKRGKIRFLPVERAIWNPKHPFGAWLAARPLPRDDPEAIWTTTYHGQARRLGPVELANSLRSIGHEVGVVANFNRSRHTRATQLLRAGVDSRYVQVYLGHKYPSSTARYTEIGSEDVAQAMKRAGFGVVA